jgi:hypothetical protein
MNLARLRENVRIDQNAVTMSYCTTVLKPVKVQRKQANQKSIVDLPVEALQLMHCKT